ncbi:MAG TPA: AraC family transcriptional regulator [Clostridiales bacterium]|nr:AraC family transcriptional regulator [Clostridiales bacterium]
MEQDLIERLWKHTDEIDEKNAWNHRDSYSEEHLRKLREQSTPLLPAELFLSDATSPIFMSFHHEEANKNLHAHDFFELIYVCKGHPIGVINHQEIDLKEGHLCIMNPNAEHYFKRYFEAEDLILNIVLPKDLFQKSIFRILLGDHVLNAFFIRYRLENEDQPSFMHFGHLEDIDRLIELLLKEYLDRRLYSKVIIESLLTLIFSLLLRNYKAKSSHGSNAMAEILDYIYMNYHSVTLELVAEHFNYHPKYLSSLIHKQTGQTFRSLIVNIRLQNALNYLLYTDYSIEQIVDLVGYKDKSSFYSLFKKEYLMSPAEYRKKYS